MLEMPLPALLTLKVATLEVLILKVLTLDVLTMEVLILKVLMKQVLRLRDYGLAVLFPLEELFLHLWLWF